MMKEETEKTTQPDEEPKHHVRLPGFLIEEEVGLGDLIKRITASAGIKPCGGCQRRAEAFNRWMKFSR
jgi:hypothetical protein